MGNPSSLGSQKRIDRRALVGLLAVCCALGALTIALPASGAPPTVSEKQRQADAILSEINSLDSDLNRAVESYNGARLHLTQTERAIRDNTRMLSLAKHNLRKAQKNIAERVVALYTGGEQATTIEIVLGARSLDEVISGLDAAGSVAAQDARIAHEAKTFRADVTVRQRTLAEARKRASELVAETASRRDAIESSIGKRQQLLASVKDEIARMQAAERRRQLQIAAQVRARLAEQAKAQAAANTAAVASLPHAVQPLAAQTPVPAVTDPGQTPSPGSAPPARYGGVVGIAMRYLGVPYQWGGASPASGFDCSGFTMYVYAQIGVSLPHYTGDQWAMGTAVSRGDLQPGDLVFFDGLGHEGLYVGNNQFIHAPHTGDVVKISSISGWYADTYVGARRL